MDSSPSEKNIQKTIVMVTMLFFFGVAWLMWNEHNADHSFLASKIEGSDAINLEIEVVLDSFLDLNRLNVDSSLLANPIFTSLFDFSIPISEFEKGTDEPFKYLIKTTNKQTR